MRQFLNKTILAIGFTSMGAMGAMGLQAMAEPPSEPSADVSAAERRASGAKGKGAPFMRLMDKIDLTESQETELQAMRDSHRDEMRAALRGDQKSEVLRMLADQDVDRQAVHAVIDAQLDAKAELMHAHTDDYLDFIEALDEDQKSEMARIAEGALKRIGERSEGYAAPEGRRSRRER
jgi:Spy/CpxP family protein refolding chaperone